MNWLKNYVTRKWQWVDENPRPAVWLAWVKGLVHGLLIYYFFLQ